jgi:hypothetical protein
VIFSLKMVLVVGMPEPSYRMAGQPKKMAAERLSFEQRKIILNMDWKCENVCELPRQSRREFVTEPPTRDKLRPMVQFMMSTSEDLGGHGCSCTSPPNSEVSTS